MIAILLAAALAQSLPTPPVVLNAIGRQALPQTGCAAYLWNASDRRLIAMASADAATLRVSIGGRTIDLARSAQDGATSLGLAAMTTYTGDGITARLDMTVVPRENLVGGAQVSDGSLEIARGGADSLIVPVAGLVGCTT
ncbi:MAG: hypothetical protein OSB00_12410 [Sphingomonas bacterium]|nr:hypothetical protein [Sphingomonas bacterium]